MIIFHRGDWWYVEEYLAACHQYVAQRSERSETRYHIVIDAEDVMAMNSDQERFRSFAERYIIERAHAFRPGHEQEDAWAALLDAKSSYGQIKSVGLATFNESDNSVQAAPGQSPATPYSNKARTKVDKQIAEAALQASKTAPRRGALQKLRAALVRAGGKKLP